MAKDPALSLLWHQFHPWPRNFQMPKQKKQTNKKREEKYLYRKTDERAVIKGN